MGVIEDAANKDTLAPLLRFSSSKSGDDTTSLPEYISRWSAVIFNCNEATERCVDFSSLN